MFDPSVKKGIAIAVALILVFSFGYFIGTTNNIQINHNGTVTEAPQTVAPVAAPTAAPTAAPAPETITELRYGMNDHDGVRRIGYPRIR